MGNVSVHTSSDDHAQGTVGNGIIINPCFEPKG